MNKEWVCVCAACFWVSEAQSSQSNLMYASCPHCDSMRITDHMILHNRVLLHDGMIIDIKKGTDYEDSHYPW